MIPTKTLDRGVEELSTYYQNRGVVFLDSQERRIKKHDWPSAPDFKSFIQQAKTAADIHTESFIRDLKRLVMDIGEGPSARRAPEMGYATFDLEAGTVDFHFDPDPFYEVTDGEGVYTTSSAVLPSLLLGRKESSGTYRR